MNIVHATRSKKAQSDIMGLLIIIVLIAFIMLFVFNFIIRGDRQPLSTDKLSVYSNFITALRDTSSGCAKDVDMEELLVDCVTAPNTRGRLTCENEERSCDFAQRVINEIFEGTKNQEALLRGIDSSPLWGAETFVLEVVAPSGRKPIVYEHGDYQNVQVSESETHVIPVYRGGIKEDMYIRICTGECVDG